MALVLESSLRLPGIAECDEVCVRNLDTGEVRDLLHDCDQSFYGKWQEPLAHADRRPWQGWLEECHVWHEQLWAAADAGRSKEVLEVLSAIAMSGASATAFANSRSLYDLTALHMASEGGHLECVKALTASRADLSAATTDGYTAAHLASEWGHAAVLRHLHESGCDLLSQTSQGDTALHLAASRGQTEVLTYLLQRCNADHLTIKNRYGQRPAEVARDVATLAAITDAMTGSPRDSSLKSSVSTCSGEGPEDRYSGRTAFGNGSVLLRNSRADAVSRLLQRTAREHRPSNLNSGQEEDGNDNAAASETPWWTTPAGTRRRSSSEDTNSPTNTALQRSRKRRFSRLSCEGIAAVGPTSFRLISMLGTGGFGQVFKVAHRQTGQLYAMKVLRKCKIFARNLTRYASTERNVLSFIKHPFIVKLHYAFQTPTCLVLVLQYCPGGNLAMLLGEYRRVPEPLAQLYISELLLAIEHLHERKVIYRDMKPENVVLDEQRHAMLTDFGLSKDGIDCFKAARSLCGSNAYLAPEVLSRSGHGTPVDLYGLGVLLHELLIGSPPFYSHDKATMLRNIVEAPLMVPNHVSRAAFTLIYSLLRRDPAQRLGAARTAEVRGHVFFAGIDWEAVLMREVPVPDLSSADDSSDSSGLSRQRVFGAGDRPNRKPPASPFTGARRTGVADNLDGWEFSSVDQPQMPFGGHPDLTPTLRSSPKSCRVGTCCGQLMSTPAFF